MGRDYVIKIYLLPDKSDYPDTPYCWCLLVLYDDWCTEGTGWAESPEKAFAEGYEYYREMCKN